MGRTPTSTTGRPGAYFPAGPFLDRLGRRTPKAQAAFRAKHPDLDRAVYRGKVAWPVADRLATAIGLRAEDIWPDEWWRSWDEVDEMLERQEAAGTEAGRPERSVA